MSDTIKSPVISADAHDVKLHKHYFREVSSQPFNAIYYKKSGILKLDFADKPLSPEKNYVYFIPQNQSFTFDTIEYTQVIAINFNCLDDDTSFKTPFIFECTTPRIAELFDIIYEKYSAKDTNNYKYFSLFYELLEKVEEHIKINEVDKTNPKILQAKSEIEKRFSDDSFNINKLADLLSVNTSYLRREFKKVYSISPISYLKNIRLQSAVSMLISNYYSIKDIAQKCGYSSPSYFIQVFHKSKGCSPQKYKETYFNNSVEQKHHNL